MRIYSDPVLQVLKQSGWTPERDVFNELELSGKKKVFRSAKEIISQFGRLKLEYIGRSGKEVIYFDVDDSVISKNMRAEMFGYSDYRDEQLLAEPDFEPIENFKWTEKAEAYIGKQCSRVGYLEDEFSYEIFVTEDGEIYLAHNDKPLFFARNYIDFLNSKILSFERSNSSEQQAN